MPVFYHEKLQVYKTALQLAVACNQLALELPADRLDLKRQLWRASTSVPFNIAEGTGGHTQATRINYLRISRGSAAECSAIFDYIVEGGLLTQSVMPYQKVRDVAAMLGRSIYKHF